MEIILKIHMEIHRCIYGLHMNNAKRIVLMDACLALSSIYGSLWSIAPYGSVEMALCIHSFMESTREHGFHKQIWIHGLGHGHVLYGHVHVWIGYLWNWYPYVHMTKYEHDTALRFRRFKFLPFFDFITLWFGLLNVLLIWLWCAIRHKIHLLDNALVILVHLYDCTGNIGTCTMPMHYYYE